MSDQNTATPPLDVPIELDQVGAPRSLYQFELDLFRMMEMARTWLGENQIAPYKLALLAGVSTSQTHRAMHEDWRPSHRLLIKVARALPEDWVAGFERDCDVALPSSMLNMPATSQAQRLFQAHETIGLVADLEAYCGYLRAENYTYATVDRSDGTLKYRDVHTAEPRLMQIAQERGYITPFFRPLARQQQSLDGAHLAVLRHPMLLGDEAFTTTYWLLQFQAFGTNFSITDRMEFAPVTVPRQIHLIRRFYEVFVPGIIGPNASARL